MTKREYYNLCLVQDLAWLRHCVSNPSAYMRPIHIALMKLAIRNKEYKPCTCHSDDNPPKPCTKQYALKDCLNETKHSVKETGKPVKHYQDVEY